MPMQQCSRRCHSALQKEQTVRVISLQLCFLCTKFIHAHWFKAISALDLISGNDGCLDLWQLSCRFSEKSDWSLVSVPICRPGCIDQTHLSRLSGMYLHSLSGEQMRWKALAAVQSRNQLNFCLIWTKLCFLFFLYLSIFCFVILMTVGLFVNLN